MAGALPAGVAGLAQSLTTLTRGLAPGPEGTPPQPEVRTSPAALAAPVPSIQQQERARIKHEASRRLLAPQTDAEDLAWDDDETSAEPEEPPMTMAEAGEQRAPEAVLPATATALSLAPPEEPAPATSPSLGAGEDSDDSWLLAGGSDDSAATSPTARSAAAPGTSTAAAPGTSTAAAPGTSTDGPAPEVWGLLVCRASVPLGYKAVNDGMCPDLCRAGQTTTGTNGSRGGPALGPRKGFLSLCIGCVRRTGPSCRSCR
jgi:hypothetical protein